MIPFALANVLTHAGLNPLCFCCCPKDEGGGGEFEDQPTKPVIGLNPLVKVIPGTVDNVVDSDAFVESNVTLEQQESRRRHQREFSPRSQTLDVMSQSMLKTLSNDDYLALLRAIALIEEDEHNNKIRIKLTTNLHDRSR